MEIVDFTRQHLPAAAAMAYEVWGDEVPDMPDAMRYLIYDYLVRYYFDETSRLNLAVGQDGKLLAFLLAAENLHEPAEADDFLFKNLSPEHRFWGECYRAYLEGNRHLENRYKADDEAVLLFFVSSMPGCGKLLMNEFHSRARAGKLRSMLLWTDNTCNYQYYFDRHFTLLDRRKADPGLPGMDLETMIFRKNLD